LTYPLADTFPYGESVPVPESGAEPPLGMAVPLTDIVTGIVVVFCACAATDDAAIKPIRSAKGQCRYMVTSV
jgi:hypothetical protein